LLKLTKVGTYIESRQRQTKWRIQKTNHFCYKSMGSWYWTS